MIRSTRSESREVWPFAHAPKALDECALKLDPGSDFNAQQSAFVLDASEEALSTDLRFELLLKMDKRGLAEAARTPTQDIDVALIVENDEARRHEVLTRWPLQEVPSRFPGLLVKGRHGPVRTDLRLVAFLSLSRRPTKNGSASLPWRLGSLLAERRFSIVRPASASRFPVYYTSFSEHGWEKHALWYVQVKNLDLFCAADSPASDVVQVHLNKDLPALHALLEASATRNRWLSPVAALLKPLITAEIFHELSVRVLLHLGNLRERDERFALDELESASVAGAVLAGLKKATRLDAESLIRIAKDEPERFRMMVHGMIGVGKNYDQNTLGRLSK